MVEKQIIWTPKAAQQLIYFLEYWENETQSSSYSNKILNKLFLDLSRLAMYPHVAAPIQYHDIRKLVMGHFSLFYTIQLEKIYILIFWDNRQDPNELNRLFQND